MLLLHADVACYCCMLVLQDGLILRTPEASTLLGRRGGSGAVIHARNPREDGLD